MKQIEKSNIAIKTFEISLYALLCVLVVLGEYPIWAKLIALTQIIIFYLIELFSKPSKIRFFFIILLRACIILSVLINLVFYWPHIFHYSYVKKYPQRWADHQSLYKYDREYDNHVVLADVFHEKTVYTPCDFPAIPFVECFAMKAIVLYDAAKPAISGTNSYSEYIDMGYVSVASLAYIFSQEDIMKQWDDVTSDMTADEMPRLYFKSKDVATNPELYIFSDENYNIFVMTMEEYREWIEDEK